MQAFIGAFGKYAVRMINILIYNILSAYFGAYLVRTVRIQKVI
jgi:hypothetical protein